MYRARLLLKMLTEMIPPGENQRHNITLNDKGAIEICLMLGDKFVPFGVEEANFDRPVSALAYEIYNLLEGTNV